MMLAAAGDMAVGRTQPPLFDELIDWQKSEERLHAR